MFICREHSSWCARNCTPGHCRPFEMTINHTGLHENDERPFLKLERPC